MSLLRRVRTKATLEADFLRLRLARGKVLASPAATTGRVALLVSLSEYVYALKLEGMLAKALQLKGLEPVALVPAGSAFARRYFRMFGVERFVEIPDYVDDAVEQSARIEADKLLAGSPTVADLKRLTFRGAAVGNQVLSSISRALHQGSVDFAEPRARELLDELMRTAVRSTLAAEALIDDLDPELLLFNERNYAYEAPLSDVALARGINVVQFVAAFQDDALVFKRYTPETRRLHPRSLSDESWQRVRELPWTPERDAELEEQFRLRYGNEWSMSRRVQGWTHERSRDEILAQLSLDPAKKTAVLFSHMLWDGNMFYGEDLFEDQGDWFVESVRAACRNDRVNWIVKLHPANVWKRKLDGVVGELDEIEVLRDRIGELPPHVAVLRPESDVGTRSVFDLADYGVTIRGTVGVELPCFDVPVLTAGTGFYSGRGFTIDSASTEEYLERLGRIDETPPLTPQQVGLARRHAYALFSLRPLRFTSFESRFRPLSEVGHPLDPNLILRIRSREELERAGDLRKFADWAVDARDLDYLEVS